MSKIVHIISGLNVGGAEIALLELLKRIRSDGKEHVVVTLTADGAMHERFVAAGVRVLTLDMRKRPLRALWQLRGILRREKPSLVQTWMYHADLLGGLVARLATRSRVVWGVHCTGLDEKHSRFTWLIQYVCTHMSWWMPDAIVCCGYAAKSVHEGFGYDSRKMVVIPNGYDLGSFSREHVDAAESRARLGLPPSALVIGIVARYDPLKDYENFIRAAAALAADYPDVVFLMVGRDITLENPELRSQIDAAGIAGHVRMLGERSDVVRCLAAMDIFCLSSKKEGFPNAVCEAMAMEVPCVVTDVGDAGLIVGETGVVVPPADSAALAAGLRKLIELPANERRTLGARARERIAVNFSSDRNCASYQALYERLVAERKRPVISEARVIGESKDLSP